MNNLHCVWRVADWSRALCWLGNLATVNVDLNCMIANLATEEGIFHVRNDWGGANDESLDSNDLVDVCLASAGF